MRFYLNRGVLFLLISVVFLLLLIMRSISRGVEPLDGGFAGGKLQPALNKAQVGDVRNLEARVDDLQKQLWEAQTYERQLIEQLKHINVQGGDGHAEHSKERVLMPPGGRGLDNFTNVTNDYIGCQEINQIRIVKTVGKGFTKIVQEGNLDGKKVAVKSAGLDVKDVQDCLKSGMYKKEEDCYVLASYKVLKEAMMLKQLKHPNIVGLLGLCLRSERSSPHIQERGMTVVVELGEPVAVDDILNLPFHERIRLCIGVAQMLIYLAESPLGSVAIQDFREDQFVMVDRQIKLADVDDLSSVEPDCNSKMQCVIDNKKTDIKCATDMKCPGLNIKANLQHANLVFFQPLLGLEVPPEIIEKSKYVVQRLRAGLMDAEELLDELMMLSVSAKEIKVEHEGKSEEGYGLY